MATEVPAKAPPASPAPTKALDGLRAILNVWILIFHVAYCLMHFLPESEVKQVFDAPPTLIKHGYWAVDGFFVLTGFLLGLQMLKDSPDGEEPKRPFNIRTYFVGRCLRIMIPYILLGAFHWFIFRKGTYDMELLRLTPIVDSIRLFFPNQTVLDNGMSNSPANLLHLSNFVPYNGVFIHSWSVGVQYHFYLWFPFFFKWFKLWQPRRLVWFTAAIVVFSGICRVLAQLHHSQFEKGTLIGSALDLFWYSHGFCRVHTMVVGFLAAHISLRTNIPKLLARRTWSNALIHIVAYACTGTFMVYLFNWEAWFGDYRYTRSLASTFFVFFASIGGVFSAAIWSYIVLATVHRWGLFADLANAVAGTTKQSAAATPDVVGKEGTSANAVTAATPADGSSGVGMPLIGGMGLSSIFSIPLLCWMADLSYLAYLLHPTLYAYFFSRATLMYPPSSVDARPLSMVACDFGPECPYGPPAAARPFMQWWFDVREFLFPSQQQLSTSGVLYYCLIMTAVVYGVSFLFMQLGEKPITSAIKKIVPAQWLERGVYGYSMLVMGVGVVAHIGVTVAAVVFLSRELEANVKANAAGAYLFANSTSNATAQVDTTML